MRPMCPECEGDIFQSLVHGYCIQFRFSIPQPNPVWEARKGLNFQVYKCWKLDILPKIVVSIYVFIKCDRCNKGMYLKLL